MSVSSPIPSSLVAWGGTEVGAMPAALSIAGVSFLGVVGCVGVAQVAIGAAVDQHGVFWIVEQLVPLARLRGARNP
jgi:hypothetical protein